MQNIVENKLNKPFLWLCILYAVFLLLDSAASRQMGLGDKGRYAVHIYIIAFEVFLIFCNINRILLFHSGIVRNFLFILIYGFVFNVLYGSSYIKWLITLNFFLLSYLSFQFFESLGKKHILSSPNNQKICNWFFFFICALIVYYSFDCYFRAGRIFVMNIVYYPLCLLPFIFLYTKLRDRLAIYVLILTLIVLGFSFKRGAYIAFALMALSLFLSESDFSLIKLLHKRTFLLITMAILLLFSLEYVNSISNGFLSRRFEYDSLASGSGRYAQYEKVFNYLRNDGMLFLVLGHGSEEIIRAFGTGIHNEWLSLYFSYGVFGLVFYVIWFCLCANTTLWYRRNHPEFFLQCLIMMELMFVLSLISTTLGGYICAFLVGFWGYMSGLRSRLCLVNSVQ